MRAVQLADYGLENIELGEAPDPTPAAGEVLISTEAATINNADYMMVSGAMASFLPPSITPPYTPGWDLAGTVVGVGEEVAADWVGKKVVGFSAWVATGHGTQASLVALPVDNVAAVPAGSLTASELTTLGLNGLTAWRAVDELALEDGQTLVVVGAAGSVGGFALELAASRGARVIAAVAESDRDEMLKRGARDIAPREAGDLGAAVRAILPEGADALFDTTQSLGTSGLDAIADGGRYVTVTDGPEGVRGITVTKVYGGPDSAALESLLQMASDGRISTPVAQEFDAGDARAAYEKFAAGPRRGRIVLTF